MRTHIRSIWAISILLVSAPAFSADRKGKAVYEISQEQGMRLNETALKNIEVITVKVSGGPKFNVPADALVHFQDQVGVYRLREGWFKLIKIQIYQKSKADLVIFSNEIKTGDEIAIHGADLLRVSELDAFEGGE